MNVMQDNPVNLKAAVRVAMAEQNLRIRFDLLSRRKSTVRDENIKYR